MTGPGVSDGTAGATRALVLDFDGIVVDSETTHLAVWRRVFREHGCEFTQEEWSTCLGTQGGFDPARALRQRSRVEVAAGTEKRLRRRYRAMVRARGLMPGVIDWLDAADTIGLRTAIASSSRADWVMPWLDEFDLRRRFAHVACYEGSVPAKPHPGLYLAACRALGADPAASIAVEDSPNGVAAAVAAGLFCVAVSHVATDASAADGAHLVLPNLGAMSLAAVLDRADERRLRSR